MCANILAFECRHESRCVSINPFTNFMPSGGGNSKLGTSAEAIDCWSLVTHRVFQSLAFLPLLRCYSEDALSLLRTSRRSVPREAYILFRVSVWREWRYCYKEQGNAHVDRTYARDFKIYYIYTFIYHGMISNHSRTPAQWTIVGTSISHTCYGGGRYNCGWTPRKRRCLLYSPT